MAFLAFSRTDPTAACLELASCSLRAAASICFSTASSFFWRSVISPPWLAVSSRMDFSSARAVESSVSASFFFISRSDRLSVSVWRWLRFSSLSCTNPSRNAFCFSMSSDAASALLFSEATLILASSTSCLTLVYSEPSLASISASFSLTAFSLLSRCSIASAFFRESSSSSFSVPSREDTMLS